MAQHKHEGIDRTSQLPTDCYLWPLKHYPEMYRRSLEEPEEFWILGGTGAEAGLG
jgi:hypothetical protein